MKNEVFNIYNEVAKLYEEKKEIETQDLEELSNIGEEIAKLTIANGYELKDIANALYLFGNDLRVLHLNVTGEGFKSLHELTNELYNIVFDAYDNIAETAISHKEQIASPSELQYNNINIEWKPLKVKNYTKEEVCEVSIKKGNEILNYFNNVKTNPSYESFVYSILDDWAGKIDKYVNYLFTRYKS